MFEHQVAEVSRKFNYKLKTVKKNVLACVIPNEIWAIKNQKEGKKRLSPIIEQVVRKLNLPAKLI